MSGSNLQISKNNFFPFWENEDVVSHLLRVWKNRNVLGITFPILAAISWTEMNFRDFPVPNLIHISFNVGTLWNTDMATVTTSLSTVLINIDL